MASTSFTGKSTEGSRFHDETRDRKIYVRLEYKQREPVASGVIVDSGPSHACG